MANPGPKFPAIQSVRKLTGRTKIVDHIMKNISENSFQKAGVRGDGLTDDGEAFQRALDSGQQNLQVPAGKYRIGRTLHIRSGCHLVLDPEACLIHADGAARTCDDYLLTNANPASGDANISIEGGQWDGNNLGNPRPKGLFDQGYSGAMIHFRNVTNLQLQHLHVRNAEAYHIRLTEVRNFRIEDISFCATKVRNNNDGIHLGGNCEQGVIRRIKGLHPGVTGDDMVALNADDALNRTEVRGMTCGPIRNILIEEIEAEGCHSFVRLLSVWSTIENIIIRNVRGSCEIAAINCDAARGCRVTLFDEANPPFPNGVGLLKNIDASDFLVSKSAANDIALLRMESRMENVHITNFRRDLEKDASPSTPTLRINPAAADLQLNSVLQHSPYGHVFESNACTIDQLLINT
jgi:polygalacturonase